MFNPEQHHRRSIRLAGYDYRNAGAYFITICTAHKRPVFGRIENGAMRLNAYGRIVAEEWERTAALRGEVELDEWIVMPNHFHAVVILCRGMACHARNPPPDCNDATRARGVADEGMASHAGTFGKPQAQALSTIVGAFKSAVTRRINAARAERDWPVVEVWQRGFYERIIRDEIELNDTRRYILENPNNWATDANHVSGRLAGSPMRCAPLQPTKPPVGAPRLNAIR